jgi:signal transduction histidine kinase
MSRSPYSPVRLQRRIDALPASTAVLDGTGTVVAVNRAWRRFAAENGLADPALGVGSSYLHVCDSPAARGTEGPRIGLAIRRILGGSEEPFRMGYGCHSPVRTAWFRAEVASLRRRGVTRALVTHVPVDEAAIRREVADEERHRIARELHDTTAQNLATALLDLEQASRAGIGDGKAWLEEATALCRRCLDEVRSLSYELAPPGLRAGRLVESLARLAADFTRRTGFVVALLAAPIAPEDGPAPECAEAIYRTMEEAVGNARRHSGGSGAVVSLQHDPGALRLVVRDHGHGMEPGTPPGRGLCDVQERLEACGGRLEVAVTDTGTTIRATVPLGGGARAVDRDRG